MHGHGQCSRCGANVEPCCTGEGSGDVAAGATRFHLDAEPQLFHRLFEQLGGPHATVTWQALEAAYVARQGADLDEAREVIAAARQLGLLVPSGDGLRLG